MAFSLSSEATTFILTELMIALIFHTLGIVCLVKEQKELQKQRILLLNLSATELLNIIYMISYICMSRLEFTASTLMIMNDVLIAAYHIVTVLFYNAMILIAGDRLLSSLFPTAYYVHVRKSTLKKSVIIIWFLSMSSSTICVILHKDISQYIDIILIRSYEAQIVFLFTSVSAYATVALSLFQG